MGTLFDLTLTQGNAGLIHQQLQLEAFLLHHTARLLVAQALKITADDLVQRCLSADLIINNAVARHIDAHIRGRTIRTLAGDQLKHSVDHREDLDIAVIIDGRFSVSLKMERVDHIDIVQIGGGGLVGKVDRMLERQVPNGEGLKLGIPCLDAALILMVQLGQADRHLTAAGAGGRDDHQRALGLDIIILAIAIVTDDVVHIVGVAGDLIVAEGADAQTVELLLKGRDLGRIGKLCHADAAHKQADPLKGIDQAQHINIIGNAVVAAHLVGHDILGADNNDDLRLILELQQHLQLGVGLEARQHAGRMVVIEQLAAKFQIELIVKLSDTLPDMGRLHRKIFIVVKSDPHLYSPFSYALTNVLHGFSIAFFSSACNGLLQQGHTFLAGGGPARQHTGPDQSGAEPHLD